MTDEPVFNEGARFTRHLSTRLPGDLYESLHAAAERQGITRNEFVRRAIATRIAVSKDGEASALADMIAGNDRVRPQSPVSLDAGGLSYAGDVPALGER